MIVLIAFKPTVLIIDKPVILGNALLPFIQLSSLLYLFLATQFSSIYFYLSLFLNKQPMTNTTIREAAQLLETLRVASRREGQYK